jgi:hypothetical protein
MEPKNPSSTAAADDKTKYRVCSNCSSYLHSRVFTVGLGCGLAARQDCGSRSRRIVTNTCSPSLAKLGRAAAIVRSWLPEPQIPRPPSICQRRRALHVADSGQLLLEPTAARLVGLRLEHGPAHGVPDTISSTVFRTSYPYEVRLSLP